MEALQNCEVCGEFLAPKDAFVSSTAIMHRVQDAAGKCKPSPVLEEVLEEAVQAPEENFGDLIAEKVAESAPPAPAPEPEEVKVKKSHKKKEPKQETFGEGLAKTLNALLPSAVEIKRSHKKKVVA